VQLNDIDKKQLLPVLWARVVVLAHNGWTMLMSQKKKSFVSDVFMRFLRHTATTALGKQWKERRRLDGGPLAKQE